MWRIEDKLYFICSVERFTYRFCYVRTVNSYFHTLDYLRSYQKHFSLLPQQKIYMICRMIRNVGRLRHFLKQTGNLPNRLYKNILYISMSIYGIIIIRWEVSHSKILQVQLGCLPIFRRSAAISLRPILFVCIGARKKPTML